MNCVGDFYLERSQDEEDGETVSVPVYVQGVNNNIGYFQKLFFLTR